MGLKKPICVIQNHSRTHTHPVPALKAHPATSPPSYNPPLSASPTLQYQSYTAKFAVAVHTLHADYKVPPSHGQRKLSLFTPHHNNHHDQHGFTIHPPFINTTPLSKPAGVFPFFALMQAGVTTRGPLGSCRQPKVTKKTALQGPHLSTNHGGVPASRLQQVAPSVA